MSAPGTQAKGATVATPCRSPVLWELHPEMKQLKQTLQQRGAWARLHQEPTCAQRFLVAANHDTNKACTMLLDMLRWRQENGIDQMLTDFSFPERDALLAAYPQGWHKQDRQGRPVYIQQLGRADIDALLAVTSEERMLMWHISEFERMLKVILPACSAAVGRPIHQSFSILDLKGIKFRDFMKVKGVLVSFCKLDNAYYPETAGHTVIINAPHWFGGVFSFFKSFMSPEAQNRVEILGCNWKEQLVQHIAPENVHHEYGGTSRGSIIDDIGPWRQWQQQQAGRPPASMHVRCSSDSSSHTQYTDALVRGADAPTSTHAHQQGAANPMARLSPQLSYRSHQPHLRIHVPRSESYNSCNSHHGTPCGDEPGDLTPLSAAALSFRSLQTASGFHTPHSSFAGSLQGGPDGHFGDCQGHRAKEGLLIGQVKRVGRLGSSFIGRRPRRRHVNRAASLDRRSSRVGEEEEGADYWCPLQGESLWQPPAAKPRTSGSEGGRSLVQIAKSSVASSFSFLAGQAGQRASTPRGWSRDELQPSDARSAHSGSSSVAGGSGRGTLLVSTERGGADDGDGYKANTAGCCGLFRRRK